ncbi:MAG: gamma-glutamyl-gamma-aminobutyrate hydrolase family protein [Christensenellaceae bacterium]|nr:gamma-glutamyl-gamma-aminobutyrate hydrolase family protein [Christensenellaceae bacterium]
MGPIIGLTPQHDARHGRVRMAREYMEAVAAAGGVAVVLPLEASDAALSELVNRLDGFLFTGGPDVDPARYGAARSEVCGEVNEARDALEFRLFSLLLGADKPVLGICRGLQLINAALGGTLHQDLPSARAGEIAHDQPPPYDRTCHAVNFVPGNPLFPARLEGLPVNSIHHQGVERLAEGLAPMAHAPDGLIEAFSHPARRFLMAVQWHPECMASWDLDSQAIFRAFVDASRR